MKAMGWDFQQYESTPASLIQEIAMFILTEKKAEEYHMEKNRGRI